MEIQDFIIKQCIELSNYLDSFFKHTKKEIYGNNQTISVMSENVDYFNNLNRIIMNKIENNEELLEELPELVAEFNSKLMVYIALISQIKTINLKKHKLITAMSDVHELIQSIKQQMQIINEELVLYKNIEYNVEELKNNELLAGLLFENKVDYLNLINNNEFEENGKYVKYKYDFFDLVNEQKSFSKYLEKRCYNLAQLNIKKSFYEFYKNKLYSLLSHLKEIKDKNENIKMDLINQKREVFHELTEYIYSDNYFFRKMLLGVVKTKNQTLSSKDIKLWLISLSQNR